MGAFEDFVNLELPRRSSHLTKDITSYDGNPNDPAAPAILQGSPLGTWFHEETFNRWWRKRQGDWTVEDVAGQLRENKVTIYVDYANGDDIWEGTDSRPIKTLFEAFNRTSILGVGVVIHMKAGDHYLLDLADDTSPLYKSRYIFGGLGQVKLEGELSVLDTFTVDSIAENVITAVGDPGWAVDSLVGKMIRWQPYLSWGLDTWTTVFIIANTSNTLTVSNLSTALGGYFNIPTGDLSIYEHATILHAAPAHSNYFYNNILVYGSDVTVQDLLCDGDSQAGFRLFIVNPGSTASFEACKFVDWSHNGLTIDDFAASHVSDCWFENCPSALELYRGYVATGTSCVWKDCSVGVVNHGGFVDASLASWFLNCSNGLMVSNGGAIIDRRKYIYVDVAMDRLAYFFDSIRYIKQSELNLHPNSPTQPTDIYHTVGKQTILDVGYFNGSASGSVGFYRNAAGTHFTQADLIAWNGYKDERHNEIF